MSKLGRWTRRRTLLLILFLAYAGLMLFGGCADKLILFPSTGATDAHGAERRFVDLPGGAQVECWVDRSPGARAARAAAATAQAGDRIPAPATAPATAPDAYVVEFTGNATRAEYVASYAALRWGPRSVEVWMVNYPGYGRSTGPATLKSIPPAALAVYDHVARRAAGRPIFLAGNSLGTTAALHVAANRPVAGLVLQNPPALRRLILTRFGWWNLWLLAGPVALQVPSELDSPTNAPTVKAPAIFALADDDELVVPSNQRIVFDAYAGPKHEVRLTGGHNSAIAGDAETTLQRELDWLWQSALKPDKR